MKRLALPIAFVVLLGLFGAWWFSPTQVVKRKVKSLLTTLTFQKGEGKVGRQAGTYSLNALLAEQVDLENPDISEANGSLERSDLETAYSWLAEQAKETRFEVQSFDSISINGDQATVDLHLTGLVELPNYRPADGTYTVTFDWRKQEDGWRLKRASWKKAP